MSYSYPKKPKRVLVCGSVYWNENDDKEIGKYVKSLPRGTLIIIGDCPGVAKIVAKHAEAAMLNVLVFKPKFHLYGNYAFARRNKDLVDRGKPDLVIGMESLKYKITGEINILEHARKKHIRAMMLNFKGQE